MPVTKSSCCCCTVITGQPMGWGTPCQPCPPQDSFEFQTLCPHGAGMTFNGDGKSCSSVCGLCICMTVLALSVFQFCYSLHPPTVYSCMSTGHLTPGTYDDTFFFIDMLKEQIMVYFLFEVRKMHGSSYFQRRKWKPCFIKNRHCRKAFFTISRR